MDKARLNIQLRQQEGVRLTAYQDSLGLWTIGVGHLLGTTATITTASHEQVEAWLDEDIAKAEALAKAHDWYAGLNDARQNVIVNMEFNIGRRFEGFLQAKADIAAGRFEKAAADLLDSLWAKQVGHRAVVLAEQLRLGVFNGT